MYTQYMYTTALITEEDGVKGIIIYDYFNLHSLDCTALKFVVSMVIVAMQPIVYNLQIQSSSLPS